MNRPVDQILVIFGASGDLTRRKLIPALFELFRQDLLPKKFAVIGIGRTALNDISFRKSMISALNDFSYRFEQNSFSQKFVNKLFYQSINTSEHADYGKLKGRINEISKAGNIPKNCIYYLATPPSLYLTIPQALHEQGIARNEANTWRRFIIEKPFGYDLDSARRLNTELTKILDEDQIYRIDHYLGKETVQNLMVTRFSNGIFEPLWNRNFVHHVEITSAESIGVGSRGSYYDKSGALCDMVQNHLLQVLALIAMEPPTRITSTAIRNETLKVFQALRSYTGEDISTHVIRGQYTASKIRNNIYKSYREEERVDPNSRTETYAALKLFVDNWRWGGVPFYIRTGKRLPVRVTEVVIHFNPTPHTLFAFNDQRLNADNQLIIRIQPNEGILFKVGMKVPGAGFNVQEINMDFHYSDLADTVIPEAYTRLLLDSMQGDSTLFARGDAVEEAWKFINPIIHAWKNRADIQLHGYPSGTWGPKIADDLIDGPKLTWRYPSKNLVDDGIYCEI